MANDTLWHRSCLDFTHNAEKWKRAHGNEESEMQRKSREAVGRSSRFANDGFSGVEGFPEDNDEKIYREAQQAAKSLAAPNTDFHGLKLSGGQIAKVKKSLKKGQDFPQHATDWEKKYAPIAWSKDIVVRTRSAHSMTPVFDENGLVIGHVGTVSGREILCHRRAVDVGTKFTPWNWLDADQTLYVGKPEGEWVSILHAKESNLIDFQVLTGVDGEIVGIVGSSSKDVTNPTDFWLLDAGQAIFASVTVVTGLAVKLGSKAIKTLARRGSKKVAYKIGIKRAPQLAARVPKPKGKYVFIKESGMTESHFAVISKVAREENAIIMFRVTNPKSTALIRRGAHGKPMELKIKTSKETGVVTAKTSKEIDDARSLGFFVVDKDGVARRFVGGSKAGAGNAMKMVEMKIKAPFWRVKPGQVIHPKTGKPMVGDYDLMGVAKVGSTGRNGVLVSSGGVAVKNRIGPNAAKIQKKINSRLDEPRVLHGGQDQFAEFAEDSVIVFLPNGKTIHLRNEAEIRAFYKSIDRQPITGKYGSHMKNKNPDISPKGRRVK